MYHQLAQKRHTLSREPRRFCDKRYRLANEIHLIDLSRLARCVRPEHEEAEGLCRRRTPLECRHVPSFAALKTNRGEPFSLSPVLDCHCRDNHFSLTFIGFHEITHRT